MLALTRKQANWPVQSDTFGYWLDRTRDCRHSLESFEQLTRYLAEIKHDGTIDDREFDALTRIAAAAFVEAEITDRIQRVLSRSALRHVLPDPMS